MLAAGKARMLTEALPYHAPLRRQDLRRQIWRPRHGRRRARARCSRATSCCCKQVGINPIVVHGGGPQIGDDARAAQDQERVRRRPARHRPGDGRDRRDGAVRLASTSRSSPRSTRPAARAVGLSGKDGNLIQARKLHAHQRDPGLEHREGSRSRLRRRAGADQLRDCSTRFEQSDIIPVIAPIGVGAERRDLQHQRRYGRRRDRRRRQARRAC